MPSKKQLTEQAIAAGIDVPADWPKDRIVEAIESAQAPAVINTAAPLKFSGKRLVEFKRHRVGPPRRSPGQRVWLSGLAARQQLLTSDDAAVIDGGRQTTP